MKQDSKNENKEKNILRRKFSMSHAIHLRKHGYVHM